ncbi:GNAT family N-acetyltransferase [Lacticaseibacillus brantae]|uniref:Acetyltransferase n=1 Tax=Lacticaseibacillus brantae DSM 23927 TaxID=1423727 RepID=A0A0R2AWH4_9LACO|nr:GNAT family N-acetyltransferase [Lacticaseibacillus brantae]KRM71809.1 acetyltransferase [Lacticaseibacillus brantae DSM 23927]
MTTEIKPLTDQDVPRLQTISRQTFSEAFGAGTPAADLAKFLDEAYSQEQLTQELHTAGSSFYFIYQDRKLAGYLKLNVGAAQSEPMGDDTLEIERIYILPEFKRQGLGKSLFEFAVQQAKAAGKQAIWLGVWEHNLPAQKFYAKLGFSQFSEHVFPVGNDPQRDLLMRKAL